MAAFTVFRPYILPEVPGCPLPLLDDAIRDACRQLSMDTWMITYDVPSFNTADGTQSYILTPPAQHEVFAVKTVVKDGELPALTPAPEQTIWRYAQADGSPSTYWYKSPYLWFNPVPTEVSAITAEAVIRPTRTATSVDDQYQEYREAIAFYAKFKLMMISRKPWYSPDDAKFNYDMYSKTIGEAGMRDSTGRVAAPLRARAAFF